MTISHINKGLKYMKKCMQAHIEVVYTFNKDFYDDFYTLIDRILGKVQYDLRVFESNLTNTLPDINKFKISMTETMELIDYCLNEFIRVILLKINKQTLTSYTFSGTNYEVFLNRTLSIDILSLLNSSGAVYFTYAGSDTMIRAYKNFLDDIPDVNSVSDLRIKQLRYLVNPYLHKPEIDKYIESPVIVLEIMDVLTN